MSFTSLSNQQLDITIIGFPSTDIRDDDQLCTAFMQDILHRQKLRLVHGLSTFVFDPDKAESIGGRTGLVHGFS
jgi:hypothetical protein